MADINDRLRNDWSVPLTASTSITPSRTTQQLIDMLVSRDAVGRAKYGTSLDRTDLSADEWAQHMLEELLDAAGYLARLRETRAAGTMTVDVKVDASDALAALPQMQAVLVAIEEVHLAHHMMGTEHYRNLIAKMVLAARALA